MLFLVVQKDLEGTRTSAFIEYPKFLKSKCLHIVELSKKRWAGFLGAISRGDITEKVLSSDRICSRHYVSGKPAALEDYTNPDWLPSLYLGYPRSSDKQVQAMGDRWARKKARDEAKVTAKVAQALLDLYSWPYR